MTVVIVELPTGDIAVKIDALQSWNNVIQRSPLGPWPLMSLSPTANADGGRILIAAKVAQTQLHELAARSSL